MYRETSILMAKPEMGKPRCELKNSKNESLYWEEYNKKLQGNALKLYFIHKQL